MKDSHLTLRLSADLARALARNARAQGVSKSQVARDAVARYLAPTSVVTGRTAASVTARELAARWATLPRLVAEEAESLGADIERGRAEPPAAPATWECDPRYLDPYRRPTRNAPLRSIFSTRSPRRRSGSVPSRPRSCFTGDNAVALKYIAGLGLFSRNQPFHCNVRNGKTELHFVALPGWRNWQTQGTQNPPIARSYGFDSHLGHSPPARRVARFSARQRKNESERGSSP